MSHRRSTNLRACATCILIAQAACSTGQQGEPEGSTVPDPVVGRWMMALSNLNVFPGLGSGDMRLTPSGAGSASLGHFCSDAEVEYDYTVTWAATDDARYAVDLRCTAYGTATFGTDVCCYKKLAQECNLSMKGAKLACDLDAFTHLEWSRVSE